MCVLRDYTSVAAGSRRSRVEGNLERGHHRRSRMLGLVGLHFGRLGVYSDD